jgi:hypothetical protein
MYGPKIMRWHMHFLQFSVTLFLVLAFTQTLISLERMFAFQVLLWNPYIDMLGFILYKSCTYTAINIHFKSTYSSIMSIKLIKLFHLLWPSYLFALLINGISSSANVSLDIVEWKEEYEELGKTWEVVVTYSEVLIPLF